MRYSSVFISPCPRSPCYNSLLYPAAKLTSTVQEPSHSSTIPITSLQFPYYCPFYFCPWSPCSFIKILNMPPKKEERKPLERLFQLTEEEEQEQIWQYKTYSPEEIDKINEFFTYFKPELTQLLKENIYENIEILSKQVGVVVHPALIKPKPEEENDGLNFDNQKSFNSQQDLNQIPENNDPEGAPKEEVKNPTCLFISSVYSHSLQNVNQILIDYCSLKMLDFCLGVSGIQVIKFNNNNLKYHEFLAITDIATNEDNKLVKLFLDWNNLGLLEEREEILQKLAASQTIEFLTLRSNQLGNEGVTVLCNALAKNTNSQLKCLDLYENQITKEGIVAIGNLLGSNGSIEFLGLAKNRIEKFEDLAGITANVGKFLQTTEQVEEYRNQEKEREAILERNKKAKQKKQAEEAVPYLDPLVQGQDGNWYLMKNAKLWLLNLSMNKLDDSSRESLDKFLGQTNENFCLVVSSNRFEDSKGKEKLRKKWGKRIAI